MEETTKKESLKDKKGIKLIKKIVKIGACVGGSAVIGCLLKKSDTSDIKGISKLLVPLGVFGLAHAAGHVASEAAGQEIDNYCDAFETIADTVSFELPDIDDLVEDDKEEPIIEVVK